MGELRDVLDRADLAARRVVLPGDGFGRLMRYRDRRYRNRRVAMVALVLAFLAIGGAIRAFRGAERHRPARPPGITVSNLADVRLAWTAPAGGTPNQPVVAGGVVYETVNTWQQEYPTGTLEAIRTTCATGGGTCRPLWSARTDEPLATPTVAGGVVYVAGSEHAYAFPASCGRAGANCEPIWTAPLPGFGNNPDTRPVVVGSVVYFATRDGGIYAFSANCGKGGATCSPLFTEPTNRHPIVRMTAADGVVYAGAEVGGGPKGTGRLYAFPASCSSDECEPLWVRRLPRPVFGLAVKDGIVIVGTDGAVSAYPANCDRPGGCARLWTAEIGGPAIGLVVEGDTIYLQDQATGVYAFPVRCGTAGQRCRPLWTATGFFSGDALSSAPPAVAGRLAYIGSTDGKLYAFPAVCSRTCRPLRTFDAGGERDRVYAAATRSMVYAAAEAGFLGFGLPPQRAP